MKKFFKKIVDLLYGLISGQYFVGFIKNLRK